MSSTLVLILVTLFVVGCSTVSAFVHYQVMDHLHQKTASSPAFHRHRHGGAVQQQHQQRQQQQQNAAVLSPLLSTAASAEVSLSTETSATAAPSAPAPPAVTVADPANPIIQAANTFMYTQSGFYSPYDPTVFSEDFVFRGPYIGPLNKADYMSTMDTFKIYEALPDISPNAWGFSIDPDNANRCWFMVRNTGTFNGAGISVGNGVTIPANDAEDRGCPETFSVTFDEDLKVKYLSVGYVADRFEGNTNGKGAAVGIFNAVGFPFPAPGPALKFLQWFGTECVPDGAYSYSVDNVPAWWTSKEKASEGFL